MREAYGRNLSNDYFRQLKEFAAKEKLEIVLSAPIQGEAGGREAWGGFRPPSPVSSVRIFSSRHRHNFLNHLKQECSVA